MKWIRIYMIVMAGIFAAYLYADYKHVPEPDWTPSLSKYDKIPYGSYLLHDMLATLKGPRPVTVSTSLYQHLNDRTDTGSLTIILSLDLKTGRADEKALLRHVEAGNSVLIAAATLSRDLQDSLQFGLQAHLFSSDADSTRLNLLNPSLRHPTGYQMTKHTVDGYFSHFDTAHAIVLGNNTKGQVNFIRIDRGKGHIFLHAAPLAFTNYFLLKNDNHQYLAGLFSSVIRTHRDVFWDEYYKPGNEGGGSPLQVWLARPGLRHAWLTALITMFVFVFFQSRRRQRVIPVLKAPENASVGFAETVARVYLAKKDHGSIAKKQVSFLLEDLRGRFHLNSHPGDPGFEKDLWERTGADRRLAATLSLAIEKIRAGNKVEAGDLLALNKLIDQFYKSIHT